VLSYIIKRNTGEFKNQISKMNYVIRSLKEVRNKQKAYENFTVICNAIYKFVSDIENILFVIKNNLPGPVNYPENSFCVLRSNYSIRLPPAKPLILTTSFDI